MNIFLDSSVLLSAAGSEHSLSRLIVTFASAKKWQLLSSHYCHAEVSRNVIKFSSDAFLEWEKIQTLISFVPDAFSNHRPFLLNASKDKPMLLSALAARSEVLLTLDQKDFSLLLDTTVYGMLVMTPKSFLTRIFHTDRDEEVAKPDETRQAKILMQGCMGTYCPNQNLSLTQYS